jgi:import inner membrane translocase subunit TIM44
VTDTSAYKKGQELVEDLKDKYETSDHPVVHKVEVGRGGGTQGGMSW